MMHRVILAAMLVWFSEIQRGGCNIPKGCPFPTCICWKVNVICKNRGKHLSYMPPLPNGTQILEFSGNYLPNISRESLKNISHLNLKEFILKGNGIRNITRDVFQLFPSLSLLDLSNNSMSTLTLCNSFYGLKNSNLSKLYLSWLNIKTIPGDCFEYLINTKLERLYLSKNALQTLNGTLFSSMKHLQIVDVSFNKIHGIKLKGLYNVTEIRASNNKMLIVPNLNNKSGQCLSPQLKVLDLRSNSIVFLDSKYFPRQCTTKLTRVLFDGNPVETIKKNTFAYFQNLKYLSLNNIHPYVEIEDYAFNISTLQVLYFHNNIDFKKKRIASVADIFKKCPNLVTLDLLGNRLSGLSMETISQMLSPLTKLETLSLQKTSLYELPIGLFSKFEKIKFLNFKNNHISSLHTDVFANVTSLETLFLDRNMINVINETSIPEIMRTNLKKFDASYNPFACTCDLVWFLEWMHAVRVSKMSLPNFPDNYVCHSPKELAYTLMITYNPTYGDCHPSSPYIILGIVLGVVAVLSLVSGSMLYRYRWHIKHWIYLMRSRRRYQTIPGDDFQYDAFVAYNASDRNWVISEMMPFLETQEKMKLCLHDRDFVPGRWIVDNIIEKMKQSRKIIIVLSNDFVKSQWCQFEMVMAHERLFENTNNSLILLMLEEVKVKHVSNILHMLLKSTTYIAWTTEKTGKELFWNKLGDAIK